MANITAVVLCYNESQNIRHCLDSVKGLCEIYVVDSGSSDDTIKICREFTDKIVEHKYLNHASQWQWALENLPITTEWILALDADFIVSEELRNDMRDHLPGLSKDVDGVYIKHRYIFGGGLIRFGGTKQFWLRIVRCKKTETDVSDLVDFRFIVLGKTIRFKSAVIEYNRYDDDISTWLKKQDKFSIRLALEEELRRNKILDWGKSPSFLGNSDERIMWLRDRWLSLPLFVRPCIYFFYRYVFSLGFLDGRAGFLYHFLQGFWLRVVVDWKILEIRQLGLDREGLLQFRETMLDVRDGSVGKIYAQAFGHDGVEI